MQKPWSPTGAPRVLVQLLRMVAILEQENLTLPLKIEKELSSLLQDSLSGEFQGASIKWASSYTRTAEIEKLSKQPYFCL